MTIKDNQYDNQRRIHWCHATNGGQQGPIEHLLLPVYLIRKLENTYGEYY